MAAPQWSFAAFRLDIDNACLWHGTERIALRPKTFNVLHYLVTHAGQLVTRDALVAAVWPETAVSDGGLKNCLYELRRVLGDSVRAPQCIATVPRLGYRFIAPVTRMAPADTLASTPPAPLQAADIPPARASIPRLSPQASLLVGRETVLQRLHAALALVRQGRRQVVVLTGEPGIGKTAVVEAFGAQISADPTVWLTSGQCVEHYGTGEAYLPILGALGQLCRGPLRALLSALLRQQAPTWLVQMPWLLTPADREHLQQELQGTTRERMLRELAEVLEVLTAEVPLVLVLEDLHWSDYATLDVLALLARRQQPARLLVLGTARPVDVLVRGHPLQTVLPALRLHGQCTELSLEFLRAADVAQYLAARFPQHHIPAELVQAVQQRTDGNPLFMVNVVEYLASEGMLAAAAGPEALRVVLAAMAASVPESLRQMLVQQLDRLDLEEQRVLEVASVAGMEFSTAAVAAELATDAAEVEALCEGLARRQRWLRVCGLDTEPAGTVAGRYAFFHSLYHTVVAQRIPEMRRMHLHRRIGAYKEGVYGALAGEIAAELALHFEQGRDYGRAVQYLQQACDTAIGRYANLEAIGYLTRALALLETLPDTPARAQQELTLQVALGRALAATQGYGAAATEQAYTRARELSLQVGDTAQLCAVLWGLWWLYNARSASQTAQQLGEQLLLLAQGQHDPALFLLAHCALGGTLLLRGALRQAYDHARQGMALYDPPQHRALAFHYGEDPGIGGHTYGALALWLLGYPEQALTTMRAALALARELAHPFSLVRPLNGLAYLYMLRREADAVRAQGEAMVALAAAQGFPMCGAAGTVWLGRAQAMQGHSAAGIPLLRQGIAAWDATGTQQPSSVFLAWLAEAYGHGGQVDEGLRLLAEALAVVEATGECWWEAELHRLTGEFLLRQAAPDTSQAEACLHQALAVARRQQARSWELRAATSLARLWQQQGKRAEARHLLAEVYGCFTEGFETADLREAKGLLAELA